MSNINRRELCNGVNFSSIKDDRFKTARISITMFLPLKAETASSYAMVPQIITRTCEKYPDFTALNKKLASLYGASVSAGVRKIGETQCITVSAVSLDDRYTFGGEKISDELSELLCMLIFKPRLENGVFCSDDLEQERRQMIDLIDSEFNEKRIYASARCLEIMCKNEAFGIKRYGTSENIEALTEKDVFLSWQQILETAKIEIMTLGGGDSEHVFSNFKKAFEGIERTPCQCRTEIIRESKAVNSHTEQIDVNQAKLVMGFRAGAAEPFDDINATRLMTAVLGGTPSSKFFTNVREKLSLCYYCSARFDRNKGIIMVESGVENKNIESAKEAILNELKELQNGNLTDFELEAAKLSASNSFITLSDTLGGMEAWYISQMLDKEMLSPKEAAERICAVTKEQVINAARMVTLDTVYVLKSVEGGTNE